MHTVRGTGVTRLPVDDQVAATELQRTMFRGLPVTQISELAKSMAPSAPWGEVGFRGGSRRKATAEVIPKAARFWSQIAGAREYKLMADWEKLEDGELLARTAGCPDAFGVFYRRHLDGVVRFVATRVASPELAADVVAEVFAAGLIASRRFDSRQGSARAWLLGIASHKVADVARQQLADRRLQMRLGMSEIMWTEEDLARIERLRGPDEASAADLLMELPLDQRHAVGQRVLAERDYPDIARAAQSSEGVIRKRVSRGLATLRIWLGEQR